MNRPGPILGADPCIAVTIARSQHAHCIAIDVAGTGGGVQSPRSRAIRRFLCLADPVGSRSVFTAALTAEMRAGGHNMTIPASDTTLSAQVHLEPAVLQALDNDATLDAAHRCGVPVPAAIVLDHVTVQDIAGWFRHSRLYVMQG